MDFSPAFFAFSAATSTLFVVATPFATTSTFFVVMGVQARGQRATRDKGGETFRSTLTAHNRIAQRNAIAEMPGEE
jgi:hypothetical protein